MRKSFPLAVAGHKTPRVIELIKRDVNKYVKRERRKNLPEDVDFWDFDCRVGTNNESAVEVHISKISDAIDEAAQQSSDSIYVEIHAKAARRKKSEPNDPPAPVEKATSDWGDT